MSPDASQPKLVVGIDLGQTCTGVAYNFPAQGSNIAQFIKSWPSPDSVTRDKVPTLLYYSSSKAARPSSWGLNAEARLSRSANGYFATWFKTMLSPRVFASRPTEWFTLSDLSHDQVKKWLVDFLRHLYETIREELRDKDPDMDWDSAFISFRFSVPTIWTSEPDIIETFYRLASQAGFGDCENHTHSAVLTEAEAVAIHVLTTDKDAFKPGDILLVCDAGGGTTDLSALQIQEDGGQRLAVLDAPEGVDAGSVLIDARFEHMSLEWLNRADEQKPLKFDHPRTEKTLEHCAWYMARDRQFQNAKCEFGATEGAQPSFSVPIRGLSKQYTSLNPRIKGGMMHYDDAEDVFRNDLFDPIVEKVLDRIGKQIESLSNLGKHVDNIVLSGGLGQSPYVKQKVEERFARDVAGTIATGSGNARSTQILVAPNPQLAVCDGLVAAALIEIQQNRSVMSQKCCPVSYGVAYRSPADSATSGLSSQPQSNSRQAEQSPTNPVKWLVRKGRPFSTDKPIVRQFQKKVKPGEPPKFYIHLVTSPLASPPDHVACDKEIEHTVKAQVPVNEWHRFLDAHKDFWKKGGEAEYEVRVVPGAADLRFELWFNGQKISKEEPIPVAWDDHISSKPALSAHIDELGVPTTRRHSSLPSPSPGEDAPKKSRRFRLKKIFTAVVRKKAK